MGPEVAVVVDGSAQTQRNVDEGQLPESQDSARVGVQGVRQPLLRIGDGWGVNPSTTTRAVDA